VPSVSPKQAKLMAAVAHGWHKPGGGGPSVAVAKEFNEADASKRKGNRTRSQRSDRRRSTSQWAEARKRSTYSAPDT
jgi:hypothetical protein